MKPYTTDKLHREHVVRSSLIPAIAVADEFGYHIIEKPQNSAKLR